MANKSTPEINASSMADIAFLLLSFFLLTTTMDQDLGIPRRLPPMLDEEQMAARPEIKKRNILQVHVNSNDNLMVDGKVMEIVLLKDVVKTFISNPSDDLTKSEKDTKEVKGLGAYPVSKGIVSLQTDRGTSYAKYMAVQNEIMKAYTELRDEFATGRYGVAYNKLPDDRQETVRGVYPLNISEAEPRDISSKSTKTKKK